MRVVLSESKGLKAALLSYGIPVAIVVAVVLVCSIFNADELVAGLVSGGIVALYYFLLWLLRVKLGQEYRFSIKD